MNSEKNKRAYVMHDKDRLPTNFEDFTTEHISILQNWFYPSDFCLLSSFKKFGPITTEGRISHTYMTIKEAVELYNAGMEYISFNDYMDALADGEVADSLNLLDV